MIALMSCSILQLTLHLSARFIIIKTYHCDDNVNHGKPQTTLLSKYVRADIERCYHRQYGTVARCAPPRPTPASPGFAALRVFARELSNELRLKPRYRLKSNKAQLRQLYSLHSKHSPWTCDASGFPESSHCCRNTYGKYA